MVTTANTNRPMPMMPDSTAYTGSYSIQCFFKFFLAPFSQRFSHSLYGCIFDPLLHTEPVAELSESFSWVLVFSYTVGEH